MARQSTPIAVVRRENHNDLAERPRWVVAGSGGAANRGHSHLPRPAHLVLGGGRSWFGVHRPFRSGVLVFSGYLLGGTHRGRAHVEQSATPAQGPLGNLGRGVDRFRWLPPVIRWCAGPAQG